MQINGPKIYFTIPIFGGIAITQTVVTSFLVTVILCLAAYFLGRGLKKRPGRVQVMTEKAVTVITNMVSEAMGEHNVRWTPFITTLFFSSLLGTFLGMTGILRSSTADISTTMTWALLVSGICWYQSIKNSGLKAWLKSFTEPIAVMTPMNIVSEIAQPVSLAFRHFGNIAGGGVITVLIYWALSGASAALLRVIAGSSVAVTFALIVLGALLFFVLKVKNGKLRLLVRFFGAMAMGLGVLGLVHWIWNLTGKPYPSLSTGAYTALFILCLLALLAGIFLLIWKKDRLWKWIGGGLLGLGLLGIILISDGPLGVPIMTLGVPAVLSLYFDVFSGVIQAFVFSLLTMIYISGACPPPETAETGEAAE